MLWIKTFARIFNTSAKYSLFVYKNLCFLIFYLHGVMLRKTD